MAEKRWIAETLFDQFGFRTSYEVERVLYETHTAHQHLVLFENKFFGKMLMLDGATQITSRDEYVYQEMMSHVPLFAHGRARDVLIVGGGDCGIAEEVLKHKTVKRLTQVEIDASVVEFAKQHYPEFTGPVFADKRFECVIDDGMKYVARNPAPLRRDHRGFDRSAGAGRRAVHQGILRGLQALPEQGRRAGHAERRALPAGRRAEDQHRAFQRAVCRRHLLPRRRADLCRRPHGDGLCQRRQAAARRPPRGCWPSATARPGVSPPATGLRNCRSAPSRCRASSPNWWPRGAGSASRPAPLTVR